MKIKILLISLFLFLSSTCLAEEFVLIMSKENNMCQHMLKIYNNDLKIYGDIRYEKHREFNAIKWEERDYVTATGGMKGLETDVLISRFDINNDGVPEIVVKDPKRTLRGIDSDILFIFREKNLDYSKQRVVINEALADQAVAVLGWALKKPFEANVYSLTEMPNEYSLGGWFYFYPFVYQNRYYISMNSRHSYSDDVEKAMEVILQFTADNQMMDVCYFIKVGKSSRARKR